ncbi:Mrp/NBP35 family ATP-binding protein [Paenibacillus aceris]|uniref:Iron-sulfur cluster carrier protein n=1 Tax=Paenibacillus aceris TaxID=869555 RepID=A0ABS4I974_9BACL|nr:Mrp/NBP35 family ATP-binding protein [Paenibacillus aceris]MBP1967477.1 ATP-binding protein involved in chromosome partitioning [Paenibacillus aceris]NHW39167.1 Mrp/NBP35 family ATP-binding protein [Paenibacillus aceris]
MINKDQLLEALKPLQEPRYNKSVVELNLVRDILIKEESVSLSLIVTAEDEAFKEKAKTYIREAIEQLGTVQVHIRFRLMTDYERNQIEELYKPASEAPKQTIPVQPPIDQPILGEASKVQFIAVASGKGGVGKSTVTVNLAVALARQGKKVGIIDADIYGFSIPDMMGIEEQPKLVENVIMPVERFGVKVISMGFFVQDNAPVIWRGPMLGKMLRNFFNEVNWGDVEYILLDLPPGTGDVALDVHQLIPQSKEVIVTTPHATAAFVAARAGAMAIQTNHEVLGIVENMSYYECKDCGSKDFIFGKGGGARLADDLHSELLAQIPLGAPDNHISEIDYSPSVYKQDSKTGQIYLDMAANIIAKLEK